MAVSPPPHTSPAVNRDRLLRKYRNEEYPHQVLYFISCFVFLVAVSRLVSRLHSWFQSRNARSQQPIENKDPEATTAAATDAPTTRTQSISLRRLPLAVLNTFRIVAFRWTVQLSGDSYSLNLTEVLLSVVYIVIIFTWTFINTTNVDGRKLDVRYWCNRAGTIAASQFPVITILGTKNNIVSVITGISYEKLNTMHRMTAGVIFVLLWTHAAGKFALNGIREGEIHKTWLWTGILALSAFSVLCIVSLRQIRAKSYELFFYTHFSMVLILLAGSYEHTKDFKFDKYIWPSLLIWGIDRLLRTIRLIVFNNSYFGFKSGSGTLDGSTELVSPDVVRLTLRRPPHFHWNAGQNAFLIMPSVSGFPFEAHPFTIASIEDSGIVHEVEDVSEKEKGNSQPTSSALPEARKSGLSWNELVFLMNIREGFTKRLATIAANKGTVKVFVDGPYGQSPDLGCFDTSVLIAGGTGVSYTLPLLLDIIRNVRKGASLCRRVVFIWAIRDARHIRWISSAASKGLQQTPSGLDIAVRIHITQGDSNVHDMDWEDSTTSHSGSSLGHAEFEKPTKGTPPSLLSAPGVIFGTGRPDICAMLKEEAEGARGRMSVNVCGSESVAQAARSALRFPVAGPSPILKGGPSITLHVESFGYA